MNENTKQMEQILDTLTNRRLSLASMLGDTLEGVMEDVEDALRTVRGDAGNRVECPRVDVAKITAMAVEFNTLTDTIAMIRGSIEQAEAERFTVVVCRWECGSTDVYADADQCRQFNDVDADFDIFGPDAERIAKRVHVRDLDADILDAAMAIMEGEDAPEAEIKWTDAALGKLTAWEMK